MLEQIYYLIIVIGATGITALFLYVLYHHWINK